MSKDDTNSDNNSLNHPNMFTNEDGTDKLDIPGSVGTIKGGTIYSHFGGRYD